MKIFIVDGPWGNITKLCEFYSKFGTAIKVSTYKEICDDGVLVIPGVGNYSEVLEYLKKEFPSQFITEWLMHSKTIAICSGMQVFGIGSEEGVGDGFGFIPAYFRRLSKMHLGWCSVDGKMYFGKKYYFAHNFAAVNFEPSALQKFDIAYSYAPSGEKFLSSINNSKLLLTQFHPELSHMDGQSLVESFLHADSS